MPEASTHHTPVTPPPVRDFTSVPLRIVSVGASLHEAQRQLADLGISALAVTDQEPSVIGVLSRTDLLRAMRLRVTAQGRGPVLHLPDGICVGDVMGRDVYRVDGDDTLLAAAQSMLRHHIHRVLVDQLGTPIGILAAADLVRAVGGMRHLDLPVVNYGHGPIVRIEARDRLVVAVDRLKKSHHQGLIVLDGVFVVGGFGIDDALRASWLPDDTRVEEAMSPAIACVDHRLPLFRVAQQLAALELERVVVTERGEAVGVITAMDVLRAYVEA